MKTILLLIFIYLLVNQIKNMWSVLFKWPLMCAQANGEIVPDVVKNTPEDVSNQIKKITPYVMIVVYIVTIFFHTYFGLKYCSMLMLPFVVLFIFFVTLEYLSDLPIPFNSDSSFPNLLTNRLFCFLETASKIAYYIAGMLFMYNII